MTPAELKSIRHALGLSARGLADALSDSDHAAIKSPVDSRTVRRWEDGTQDIPHPVVVLVKILLQRAKRSATKSANIPD